MDPSQDDATEVASGPPESGAPEGVREEGFDGTSDTTRPVSEPVVVGRPTPEFEPRAIDAAYRQFPYRPDTSLDGWSTDVFAVRAASIRGQLHRYNGTPRQDDFALAIGPRPDQLIIAIADGISAAPQSHIGSTTAVRYAVQWLATAVADPTADTDWKALVHSTAWALVEQLGTMLGDEDRSAERIEQLVATTLVCAVVDAADDGGALVHVIGVGDSGAWIVADGAFTKVGGGKSDGEGGVSVSAVVGLPRVPTEVTVRTAHVKLGEVLILGTDGVGDPLGTGDGDVGSLFCSILLGRVPRLIEFVHALDFSRETFDDDRTLVAVWPLDRQVSAN